MTERQVIKGPRWLSVALRDEGLRELPGAPTAPRIAAWLQQLGAWWRDDETPWCGTAAAAWMTACGIQPPKAWYRAMAWASWGVPIAQPRAGAVVVFKRQGGGHVGLLVGMDDAGRLLVLGGNQGDAVSVAAFDLDRLAAMRWPTGEPLPDYEPMALASAPVSLNEA